MPILFQVLFLLHLLCTTFEQDQTLLCTLTEFEDALLVCAGSPKGQLQAGVHQAQYSCLGGEPFSALLCTGVASPGVLHAGLGATVQGEHKTIRECSHEGTTMVKGPEEKVCGGVDEVPRFVKPKGEASWWPAAPLRTGRP